MNTNRHHFLNKDTLIDISVFILSFLLILAL